MANSEQKGKGGWIYCVLGAFVIHLGFTLNEKERRRRVPSRGRVLANVSLKIIIVFAVLKRLWRGKG